MLSAHQFIKKQVLDDHTAEEHGFKLIADACLTPFMKISGNAGVVSAKSLEDLVRLGNHRLVYDAPHRHIFDREEIGVIDPANVLANLGNSGVA